MAGLEQFVFVIKLWRISHCGQYYSRAATSSSLNAARLFKPLTRASFAKKSLPWRDFHLVEDEDEWRAGCTITGLRERQVAHFEAKHTEIAGRRGDSYSKLSVSCRKRRRDSIKIAQRLSFVVQERDVLAKSSYRYPTYQNVIALVRCSSRISSRLSGRGCTGDAATTVISYSPHGFHFSSASCKRQPRYV